MRDRKYDDCQTLKKFYFWCILKNVDIDKYKYFGYALGFDRRRIFSTTNGFSKNVISFAVDMSSSVYVDNKKKDILILGKDPTQGSDDITLTAEKTYQ